MNALSPFVTRRLWRSVIALLAVGLFVAIQSWQSKSFAPSSVGITQGATSTRGIATASSSVQIFLTTIPTTSQRALVVRAVDGDTLVVKLESSGEEAKVRLLGMNTPESVDPRRPVQCFGKEASQHMKDIVEGKTVLLLDDPKADDRDKYGRLLRTVVRDEDKLDVNATLVAQGYANAYLSFPLDGKRKAQIRALEQEAKSQERGLWSPSTCEGKK